MENLSFLNTFLFCSFKEDYKKLEVLVFEMETQIASLEEELAIAYKDKEEAQIRSEILTAEMEALSDKLNLSNSELKVFEEEVLSLVCLFYEFLNFLHSN